MKTLIYFIFSILSLLADVAYSPFIFRPIFITALGAIGLFILDRKKIIYLFIFLAMILYFLTSFEQALKILFFLFVALFVYHIFNKKNVFLIIFLIVLSGVFIFSPLNFFLLLGNFILTFIITAIVFKLFKIYPV